MNALPFVRDLPLPGGGKRRRYWVVPAGQSPTRARRLGADYAAAYMEWLNAQAPWAGAGLLAQIVMAMQDTAEPRARIYAEGFFGMIEAELTRRAAAGTKPEEPTSPARKRSRRR